jgi:hypothetical protein
MSSFDDFEIDIDPDIINLYNPEKKQQKKRGYNPEKNNRNPSLKVMKHYFTDTYTDKSGNVKKWTTSHVCPKTFGEKCPTCDSYWEHRNRKDDSPQLKTFFEKYISKRSATISHLWNVLVKDDKTNPEHNGKVKVYYSRFRSLKSGEYVESPIVEDADAMKEILNQCHDFNEFVSPDKILSYDAIAEKLKNHDDKIFGLSASQASESPSEIGVASRSSDGPGVDVPAEHNKNVSRGNDDEFWGGESTDNSSSTTMSVSDDDFDMDFPSPSKSTPSPAGADDDDDDDLPF